MYRIIETTIIFYTELFTYQVLHSFLIEVPSEIVLFPNKQPHLSRATQLPVVSLITIPLGQLQPSTHSSTHLLLTVKTSEQLETHDDPHSVYH